jgi:diketogulonate reductase-like aldo/keto reductase
MSIVVANGARIPSLGYGTYGMQRNDMLRMIPHVLRAGFRHIDTAQMYGNEAEVGEGWVASGVSRQEIFITTKVWVANYHAARFERSVDESLYELRTDYIDLLLLHWPSSTVPLADQIGALNAVQTAGKVRHIGVSNFNARLMLEAARLSAVPLVTNQFEYHPYLGQSYLIAQTRRAGLAVTGYCGMAIGRVLSDPVLQAIAQRYHRSVAQVVLRWLVQQDGVVALSRTLHEERATQNLEIFDFSLDGEDMAAIHALAEPGSRIVDPPGLAPLWDSTDRGSLRKTIQT